MKFEVMSIRDICVGFGPVICEHSISSAVRNFRGLASSRDIPFTDYELYRIGTYDTKTGLISSLAVPELVVRGSDCATETIVKEADSDAVGESE